MQINAEANKPQGDFLMMPHKFRAFVAGMGSGKTWVGCMASCMQYWQYPKINQGYFAPTYPQIRNIFYPTVEEVAYNMGLRTEVRVGNNEVHFYSGNTYRGTTICRSMERPETIVGFKIGHALIDEFDLLDTRKAELAWRKIIARMRYRVDGLRNGIDVTTTPEGFKATYKLFVTEVLKNPKLATSYGMIQASTYDNEINLPNDYIQSMVDIYPAELISAYLNGQFTNLTTGTVYRSYNRLTHNSTETIQPKDILHIGMDFNVQKMAATVYVTRPNGWHAVAEFTDLFDTPDMISAIKERYQSGDINHRIIIYPDATGKNRETNNASTSDIALLTQARFEIRANNINPEVKNRISATNKQFEIGNLWINSKACPISSRNLEQQAYDDNGRPSKKDGMEHQNDATTYPIAYTFPIQSRNLTISKIYGL